MKKPFNVLAIIGKPRDQQAIQTHKEIYHWLRSLGYTVFIDDRLREILTDLPTEHFASLIELGKKPIWRLWSVAMATCLVLRACCPALISV